MDDASTMGRATDFFESHTGLLDISGGKDELRELFVEVDAVDLLLIRSLVLVVDVVLILVSIMPCLEFGRLKELEELLFVGVEVTVCVLV